MNDSFQDLLRQQKEDIERMHEHVIRLEARIDANERLMKEISGKLYEIRTINTKTHWITICVLVGVILLLGTT